jgi:hypothetical protein
MTSQAPLDENGQVTLDGSGNGKLRLRPHGGQETWLPYSVSVKCSTNASEALCRVYIGPSATDPYFVDETVTGSTGDSSGRVADYTVDAHGSYLWAVWTGGDPGATGTMRVAGIRQTP